jgi:hypothetical protein
MPETSSKSISKILKTRFRYLNKYKPWTKTIVLNTVLIRYDDKLVKNIEQSNSAKSVDFGYKLATDENKKFVAS